MACGGCAVCGGLRDFEGGGDEEVEMKKDAAVCVHPFCII